MAKGPPRPGDPGFRGCQARRTNGEPCTKPAMKGLNVCRTHGGGNPKAKAAGLRRWNEEQAEKKAVAILEKMDVQPLDDPIGTLENLAAEALAFKNLLAEKINNIEEWRYQSGGGAEQLRAELALYERALDRVTKLLVELQRLGLEERRVRINEMQQRLFAERWLVLTGMLFTRLREELPDAEHIIAMLEAEAPDMAKRALASGTR